MSENTTMTMSETSTTEAENTTITLEGYRDDGFGGGTFRKVQFMGREVSSGLEEEIYVTAKGTILEHSEPLGCSEIKVYSSWDQFESAYEGRHELLQSVAEALGLEYVEEID